MSGDGLGRGEAGGEEEGGPVDAVEADDLFADEVEVGGPVLFELCGVFGGVAAVSDGGHVVGEGVEPNVDDVGLVARDGNAPLEAGAGDGEVFKGSGGVGGAGGGAGEGGGGWIGGWRAVCVLTHVALRHGWGTRTFGGGPGGMLGFFRFAQND